METNLPSGKYNLRRMAWQINIMLSVSRPAEWKMLVQKLDNRLSLPTIHRNRKPQGII
jgi:hypothetical protein